MVFSGYYFQNKSAPLKKVFQRSRFKGFSVKLNFSIIQMNKKLITSSILALLLPVSVLADINFNPPSGNATISPAGVVVAILNFIWPIIVAAVIIAFITAGLLFVTSQGEPGKINQARNAVIWGIAGIVVILLAFSIMSIVQVGIGIF